MKIDWEFEMWLSSKCHEYYGFSHQSLIAMLAELSFQSSSVDTLIKLLKQNSLDCENIGSFANEIIDRNKQKPDEKSKPKSENINNKASEETSISASPSFRISEAKDYGARKRAAAGDSEAVPNQGRETEAVHSDGREREVPGDIRDSKAVSGDGSKEEVEADLEKDRFERDRLDDRIRQRELDKTKILAAKKQVKEGSEMSDIQSHFLDDPVIAAKLERNASLKDNPEYLERLRVEARRAYLHKREEQELELGETFIKEKTQMYRDIELTEKEKAELAFQKQATQIARKVVEERAHHGVLDLYKMPESYDEDTEKRLAVVHQKYSETHKSEDGPNKGFNLESEMWESHQIASAKAKFGSAKPKSDSYKLLDEYGEIDFEIGDTLPEFKVFDEDDVDGEEFHKSSTHVSAELRRLFPHLKLSELKIKKSQMLQNERRLLPIWGYRNDLLKAVRDYTVLIVIGETGSGKTTQLPQFLHEVGYTKIGLVGCTQPRRVAAMSVATRVADELGVKVGHEVGYSIRFEDCTSEKTKIKYMTDGMLLREFITEPDLAKYSVLMVDEAHERTLHTDVLFGLVKDLARYRDDFKLIISSATLEAEKFSSYFDDAPIFKIPGRKYPVEIFYTKSPEANYLDASVVTVLQIHVTQPLGDVLVFLPGQQEIEEVQNELERRTRNKGREMAELRILPIYGNLPSDEQAKIFAPTPPNARKVILATNIAETSITIDNIVYVIDTGYAKQHSYNPKTALESLLIVPCSKASVNQRAGRAGRVRPGMCFRLYTKWCYENELDSSNIPEILRSNLGNVVLSLKCMGIDDLINFDFMDKPSPDTLMKSLELLYSLDALNADGDLTKLGRQMAEFPIDPMYSKMIIHSESYGCVEECITICSMLSLSNAVFYCPKEKKMEADNARRNFFRPGGDHITLLNVYNQWEETGFSVPWCYENFIQMRSMRRARDVRDQLVELLDRVEIEATSNPNDIESIRKSVVSGFFVNCARLTKSGSYKTIKFNQVVDIHPQSSLFTTDDDENKEGSDRNPYKQSKSIYRPYMVVYNELVKTSKEYMRNVIDIDPKWLVEVAPHFYDHSEIEFGAKMPKTKGSAVMGDQ